MLYPKIEIWKISRQRDETANPGRDVNAEIDHIAIKVMRGIVPLPVFIFIYLLVKSLDWKNNNTSGIKFKITRNDF